MSVRKKKLFFVFVIIFSIIGLTIVGAYPDGKPICLFKILFHMPCPGCGISRGISAAVRGHFSDILSYNYLSVPILICALAAVLLNIYDLILCSNVFDKVCSFIKHHWHTWMFILLFIIAVITWICNIVRGL